jgi:hypothetical protein
VKLREAGEEEEEGGDGKQRQLAAETLDDLIARASRLNKTGGDVDDAVSVSPVISASEAAPTNTNTPSPHTNATTSALEKGKSTLQRLTTMALAARDNWRLHTVSDSEPRTIDDAFRLYNGQSHCDSLLKRGQVAGKECRRRMRGMTARAAGEVEAAVSEVEALFDGDAILESVVFVEESRVEEVFEEVPVSYIYIDPL